MYNSVQKNPTTQNTFMSISNEVMQYNFDNSLPNLSTIFNRKTENICTATHQY